MGDYTQPPPIVIFDIDGTLADCAHRRHFVEGKKKDFNAFYEAMGKDTPFPHMVGLHNMYFLNNWKIVYCTGRPEKYRSLTRVWLHAHGYLNGSDNLLLMRPSEEAFTPDSVIKQQMFDHLTKQMGYKIHIVFDDRQRVVDMWRRNDVPCLQVAPGNF